MAVARVLASPWAASRRRASTLRERHDFAAEPLTLYLALLDVWEDAWAAAREEQPADLAGWATERVLPRVVAVTAESGPAPLASAMKQAFGTASARALLAAYLAGEELVPVERYLARAALRGSLEALDPGAACAADPSPRGERRCPHCGGPPQLSVRSATGDRLVSGQRSLLCARCARTWRFSGSTCVYCGQSGGTVFAEAHDGPRVGRPDAGDAVFPHVRIEACRGCERYLVDVDLGRDPRAVPEVDELAALPLDLYAAEHGYTKITPNLMGF